MLLFERPVHAQARVRETEDRRLLFLLDPVHEVAPPAVQKLLRVGPLNLAAAERTRNHPAGPARVCSPMGAVERMIGRNGTDAELLRLVTSRLPSALLILPAVQLWHFRNLTLQ